MALIPPFFLDAVVTIGYKKDDGSKDWVASGFLIGEYLKGEGDDKRYWVYLATNRHVFEGKKEAFVRFNPQEAQPAREYTLRLENEDGTRRWSTNPDPNVDVAVIPINVDLLKNQSIQYFFFRSDEDVAERKKLLEIGMTEGDFVYILGFPMGLTGGERNFVIVRQGVIARIRDALTGPSQEYILDAFVFPGNSGGPVVSKPERLRITDTKSVSQSFLIGMVKSYIPFREVAVSAQTGRPRVVFEENSGLAAVVPIDFVREAFKRLLESQKTSS